MTTQERMFAAAIRDGEDLYSGDFGDCLFYPACHHRPKSHNVRRKADRFACTVLPPHPPCSRIRRAIPLPAAWPNRPRSRSMQGGPPLGGKSLHQ